MTKVKFYAHTDDKNLKFAVIAARADGKWIFCKHKSRSTLELPGGHREAGEEILSAAKRELYEETGAVEYDIKPVCVYSVKKDGGSESFGMLYFAEVFQRKQELCYEIEETFLLDEPPANWTYPEIQPKLLEKVKSFIN